MNGPAVSILRAAGLANVLQRSNAAPLTQFHVRCGCRGATIPLSGAVAIDRATFDSELVHAAVAASAEFLPATLATVQRNMPIGDVRQVSLSSAGCGTAVASGRVVIVADGLGHPSLKQWPQFACNIAADSRIGLSLSVKALPDSYEAGVITMAISHAGYCGIVRTHGGSGNLAAAIDAAALRCRSPEDVVAQILTDARLAQPDFSGETRWLGTLPLTRRSDSLSAERIVLLGDAAGYVEPFTGEGIGWAMQSAISAAPMIVRNLEFWNVRAMHDWDISRRRQLARSQTVCRLMASALRKPRAVRLALAALAFAPGLAWPFVRHYFEPSPSMRVA